MTTKKDRKMISESTEGELIIVYNAMSGELDFTAMDEENRKQQHINSQHNQRSSTMSEKQERKIKTVKTMYVRGLSLTKKQVEALFDGLEVIEREEKLVEGLVEEYGATEDITQEIKKFLLEDHHRNLYALVEIAESSSKIVFDPYKN